MDSSKTYADQILKQAHVFLSLATKKSKLPETSFIFPSSHPNVESGNHFPIDTEGRARNALARANQYKSVPKWYRGSLKSLINAVTRAVKKRYPGIEISEKSKKPGKG